MCVCVCVCDYIFIYLSNNSSVWGVRYCAGAKLTVLEKFFFCGRGVVNSDTCTTRNIHNQKPEMGDENAIALFSGRCFYTDKLQRKLNRIQMIFYHFFMTVNCDTRLSLLYDPSRTHVGTDKTILACLRHQEFSLILSTSFKCNGEMQSGRLYL